jgi:hypothetical protein
LPHDEAAGYHRMTMGGLSRRARLGAVGHHWASADRVIAHWLLAVAALIFCMVVLGGVTRLTESGLSIVEWQPLIGTVPPLSDAAWTRCSSATAIPRIPEGQSRHDA